MRVTAAKLNVEVLEQHDRVDEAYIAIGRLKHHERIVPTPTGRIPAALSVKEKMATNFEPRRGEPNTLAASNRRTTVRQDQNATGASGSFCSAAWRR